ncbi:DUF4962 domain-containing protein [Lapidilactobacillus bayanensis]|uniref:DUF4962 domain-containing protein n=1 Tax=Lapidilactobacillus bayanensis TaxID=2485998 RepID=UPI0013DE74F3|nr:DUF4962 domain-containing protein [Lapidilactobacillus bayanensis]
MSNYLLIGSQIDEYQESINTYRKKLFLRLLKQCYRYTTLKIPTTHPQKSITYMGMAIVNLALAYRLTGQEDYLQEAKRWMASICKYEKWGNAHLVDVDLSASWVLIGLALGFDWLSKDLDVDTTTLIVSKLILQGQKMYDFKEKNFGSSWTIKYWQNHNWINHTAMYIAGQSLIKNTTFSDANIWIKDAQQNFAEVFAGLADDGSDYEGAVYWRYGVFWLFIFNEVAYQLGDTNYYCNSGFLRNTFYYRLYQSNGDLQSQVGFGDCHDRQSSHSIAMYYLIAKRYNDGYAQNIGNLVSSKFLYHEAYESKIKPGILPEAAFEFLFYDKTVIPKHVVSLPLSRNFPDLGLVYIRSSWQKDALIYTTKCSAPGGNKQWKMLQQLKHQGLDALGLDHHHPDNNSFVLLANNSFLAVDEGYDRSATVGDHKLCANL